jgi:L,D-peptidoglycan transpeptidase YkuD (ErfK/YbiS/YcfS/YnhG family)
MLLVRPRPGSAGRQGIIAFGGASLRCALGRSGIAALKKEGDGATPRGRWALRMVYYRPDRVSRPRTALPVRPLTTADGWCDDPADRNYNRPVRLPYGRNTESMWRQDQLYDLVVVLGYNDLPRKRGAGSAIFMHLAREGYTPSEGCITLARHDLQWLLAHCGCETAIDIVG